MKIKEQHTVIISVSVVAIILGIVLSFVIFSNDELLTAEDLVGDTPAPSILDQQSDGSRKEVVEVLEGVHVAIGYALGNSILVEGPEGIIIIDTTESVEAGQEIFAAFRNITKAPVKAIIYTHNHADHIYGVSAFIEDDSSPQIWAHKDLPYLIDATASVFPITYIRMSRQFGTLLEKVAPSSFRGNGPSRTALRINENMPAMIGPTHILDESSKEVVLAGLSLSLVHIPGETMDQIGVWIPSKKAFFCADNVYKSFPNLYAIRGTPPRDTLFWAESIDKMVDYEPEYLILSHGPPLTGKEYIKSVLNHYRDAILFVHDQTVRYMNKGMHPDDIVAKVQLPDHMANHPYLIQFYGTVEWSVRGVFDRYMGWFSGSIEELSRHTTIERAKRMVKFGGGRERSLEIAQEALEKKDFRWSLEVATHVLKVYPEDSLAKMIRFESLKALASQYTSTIGRNYYLSVALEDHQLLDTTMNAEMKRAAIMASTPAKMFGLFSLRLKAEDISGVDKILIFDLTDVNEQYSLHVRNSVLNVKKGELKDWNTKVSIPFGMLKKVFTKDVSLLTLYKSGDLKVEGAQLGCKALIEFLGYFDMD